ncbi:cbb3-type cytochrome c oxidase subunit I [Fodinibius halophilus]|uniref:Cbb3-type cytochrome c oxidase subunit I n=1 Tax=Fodinibius halophilus TaxID=1736908 RepID=A0A6M1TD76_9BACT|nr:cbb3-type cytochrome c oxidase subunit I [Fodinibius halophilus]NGP88784.1 hypothetical protein [Fodinibius halophilus]
MLVALKKILTLPVASLLDRVEVDSKTQSRLWILMSIGTLLLSGFFSVIIVLGRAPIISELISDPLFAKRGLVVHVDLALLIWIYAFLCGLFVLVPTRKNGNRLLPMGYALAVTGVGMLVASIFVPSAEPVLSNYIPVLDHPLFIGGLLFFAGGVACTVFNTRIIPSSNQSSFTTNTIFPASSIPGFRSAAVILLISLITFFSSWLVTPMGLEVLTYYELTIWGGGHLLQFVNVAAMLSVWIILLGELLGKNPISYRVSAVLFGIYTLPLLAAPLLTMNGTGDLLYHWGFTRFMQWGIFPVVTIFVGIIVTKLVRARANNELPKQILRNPYFGGLVTSMLLTIIGFILGAMIRGSNTMVPAHYHAAVGGITVAFMAITYFLLEVHGVPIPKGRLKKLAAIQPLLFGLGQAIFAAGFGYAGAHGLARKSFGSEQHIGSIEAFVGLGFMTVGGLLAVSGGLLFLWIVVKAWMNRKNSPFQSNP